MKSQKKYVKLDLRRIFLTFPQNLFERAIVIIFGAVTFAIYFGPLMFREINPVQAAIAAAFPTLTTSWGLLVLTRSIFLKTAYMKTTN